MKNKKWQVVLGKDFLKFLGKHTKARILFFVGISTAIPLATVAAVLKYW